MTDGRAPPPLAPVDAKLLFIEIRGAVRGGAAGPRRGSGGPRDSLLEQKPDVLVRFVVCLMKEKRGLVSYPPPTPFVYTLTVTPEVI